MGKHSLLTIIVWFILFTQAAFAQTANEQATDISHTTDSVRTTGKRDHIEERVHLITEYSLLDSVSELALQRMDDSSIHSLFINLQHTAKTRKNTLLGPKVFYNMAVLFARLKNYPLALKFFSYAKAESVAKEEKHKRRRQASPMFIKPDSLEFALADEKMPVVYGADTLFIENRSRRDKSKPITVRKLLEPFRDEEEGTAYGVILHVKQPKYGKRKPFTLINNVGHMFVTLIKFEENGQTVSRTFGFYPSKQNPLSATPIIPATNSTFKNDSYHDWDELVGRFISYKQFKLIVHMIRQYSRKRYHLSTNNCTDFGLCISEIAGIGIKNTKGSWPLGKGNDPGDTGQSLYEGQFYTLDPNDQEDVFSCTSLNKVE